MSHKRILIDAVYPEETRVVICENNVVQDFDYETAAKKQIKGFIYLAKITRVEAGLQAAFIDYGGDKHGFLPFSEIHPDYYQIPVSDRSSLEAVHDADIDIYKEDLIVDNEDDQDIRENLELQIKALTPPDLSQDDQDEIVELPKREEEELSKIKENIIESSLENDIHPDSLIEEYNYASSEDQVLEPINDVDNIIDENFEEDLPKRPNFYRNYKIQEVLKRGQIILVQAIKEERGNKGASFTSYISLAGRYCVLMPNSDRQGGVSRRITDLEDRKRLKNIIDNLNVPQGSSVIVRTAGSLRNKADIKRDYDYLVRLWNSIRDVTLSSKAPAFVHAEGDIIKRTIRDLFDSSISEIMIQGDQAYKSAKEFIKMIIPAQASRVKQYKGKTPIFCRYQIEEQISSLYSQVSHLSSGGYIVINQTEALTAIDVNSGKSTSERNIEETATKTNLEAVHEIARQLRLRDLSGLIVIDFIDMMEIRNRRAVEKALREALIHDRAKIQVGMISSFGLLEMSRQRLRPSLIEANTITCTHCNSKGFIRAPESNAVMILRTIESEICKGDFEAVNIYALSEVIIYILNNKRDDIKAIEERYNTKIYFHPEHNIGSDSFSIERIRRNNDSKPLNQPLSVEPEYREVSIEVEQEEQKRKNKSWKRNVAIKDEEEFINQPPSFLSNQQPPEKRRVRNEKRKPQGKRKKTALDFLKQEILEPLEIFKEPTGHENTIENPHKEFRNKRRKHYRGKKGDKSKDLETVAPVKAEGESLLKGLWKRILE